MVTTRRGTRATIPQNDESGSSDTESDIPAEPVRARAALAGTVATLRPPVDLNLAKRKRDASAALNIPQPKRPRRHSVVRDTIEVELEDDDVDKALEVANARFGPRKAGRLLETRIEIPLGSIRRRPPSAGGSSTEAPAEPSTTHPGGRRLRSRLPNRHANTMEVVHGLGRPGARSAKPGQVPGVVRETPQPDGANARREEAEGQEAASPGADSPDELLGSPELQSSALKPRPARYVGDVYEIPDDESEAHSPAAARPPAVVHSRDRLRRGNVAEHAERTRSLPPNHTTLLDLRELAQPRSTSPSPLRHGTRSQNDWLAEHMGWTEDGQEIDGLGEPGESDEEEETIEAEPSPVSLVTHPHTASQRTLSVRSDELNDMLAIMGRRGWTGSGVRWRAELLRLNTFGSADEPPARTRRGRRCLEALICLQDELDEVPNAIDLAAQSRYLERHAQPLEMAMTEVNTVVSEIAALPIPADPDRRLRTAHESLEAFSRDLCSCVIPMLVLVLQASFSVGVEAPDAEVGNPVPGEGLFTGTTAQFLLWSTSWLLRLRRFVGRALGERVGEDKEPEPSPRAERDGPERDWRTFAVVLQKWADYLKDSVDGYNQQVDRDWDLFEKKRRDEALKEAKRKEVEEARAHAHRQEQACFSSIQQILNQPRPFTEMWRRAIMTHPPLASGSSSRQSATENNDQRSSSLSTGPETPSQTSSHGRADSVDLPWDSPPLGPPPPNLAANRARDTDTVGRTAERTVQQQHQQQHQQQRQQHQLSRPPSPKPNYPPWPEDYTAWFLEQLNDRDRPRDYLEVCADALERPLEEVRMEKERLRRLGLYASPGRGR